MIKTIPKKKKCKKAKCLYEEALQIAEKREAKGKGEKERYKNLNAELQGIARRDKKVFLSDQCKKKKRKKKIIEWERVEISSRKLEIPREHFMQRWAQKDRNGMDLTEAEDIKKRWQEYTKELYKKELLLLLLSGFSRVRLCATP